MAMATVPTVTAMACTLPLEMATAPTATAMATAPRALPMLLRFGLLHQQLRWSLETHVMLPWRRVQQHRHLLRLRLLHVLQRPKLRQERLQKQ